MLKVKDLTFSYSNGHKVLENASFNLEAPSLCLLKSPNGSGKTTLFRILSGLIENKKGLITFNDQPLEESQVSLMSSNYNSSFFHLNGEETLALFSSLNKVKWIESPFHQRLLENENYQKALKTKFSLCSTGMKQILNFARALSKDAPILLLDEPFQGLDRESRKSLSTYLKELSKDRLIVIATHEDLDLDWDHKLELSSMGGLL